MKATSYLIALCGVCVLALPALPLAAQAVTMVPPVVENTAKVPIERIKVHSKEIEGNLLGTPADRDVIVVLPPSYDKQPNRRYPVVYALHGYTIGAEQWFKEIHVPQTIEGAFAQGTPEMILVFPDSENVYNGAFYSNSVTTGNFENFIADELIRYIDGHYRTLARAESRGLVGHSMGGYGASRIGIKHAEMYGALYVMSPCCQTPQGSGRLTGEQVSLIEHLPDLEATTTQPFIIRGSLALAAAFSPNPNKPPFYVDLPVDTDGKDRPLIVAKWAANAPLAFLDQYVSKVRKYRAIAMDVGNRDGLVGETMLLHQALLAQGIPNTLDVFDGDHTDHVAYRFQDHVLPFFGQNLAGAAEASGK